MTKREAKKAAWMAAAWALRNLIEDGWPQEADSVADADRLKEAMESLIDFCSDRG